jgi:acetylornithine deacetylase
MVKEFGKVDFAIVGEPTQMKLAIAEKGLVVVDCVAKGKAGHAARNEGINSIYLAIDDIEKIRNFRFEKVSPLLGEVKMTVTLIDAGFQHNVIPDECRFVIDIRTNELYSNEEVVAILAGIVKSEVKPRSLRLNSSGIRLDHPFVKRAEELSIECYGSPTLSDQSLMPFQSVKIGPGDSARSHTADEYVYIWEIEQGIRKYIDILEGLAL